MNYYNVQLKKLQEENDTVRERYEISILSRFTRL